MTDLVFIQKGNTFYFPLVLRQALLKCPNSRIFVITDMQLPQKLLKLYPDRLLKVDMQEVDSLAAEFRKHYVHLSPNRLWLERFCFERWFFLLDAMKRKGLKRVLYLDSDVLVLEDVAEWVAGFVDERVLFSLGHGPHFTFFSSRKRLELLCDKIHSAYSDPKQMEELKAWHHREFIEGGRQGGVCDMSFFERYAEELGEVYQDSAQLRNDRFVDHCFRMSEGYEIRWGVKRVWRKNGRYACRVAENGDWAYPLAFHFQGGQKIRMPLYTDKTSLTDWMNALQVFVGGVLAYIRKFPHFLKRRLTQLHRLRSTRSTA